MTSHYEVAEHATPSNANTLQRTAPLSRALGATERAFDRIDARLDNPQSTGFEGELVAFMRSPRLDTVRRLRAACRLLVIAEGTANPALAVLVYHDLLRLAPTDDDARAAHDQALLIYHGAFGRRVDALRLARETIARANSEPHSWSQLQARINAAHALQLVGASGEVVAQLEECYSLLLAVGARANCVLVASRLARVSLDVGDVSTAKRWTHAATSHVRSRFSDHSSHAHLSIQADLALIDGDFAATRRLISSMRVTTGGHHGGRREMDVLIHSLRLAQCEGNAVDDADVDRLMRRHLRARSFGGHDDAMECLWVALVNQRRLTLASDLLLEYVGHYRRETRSCNHFLRMRSATDPAWKQLPSPKGGTREPLGRRRPSPARWNGLSAM
jgi:hypothetical protein